MRNPLMRSPRYRFRRICEALSIVPYDWQRDYVLYDAPLHRERACGQTTAVILRLLVESYPCFIRPLKAKSEGSWKAIKSAREDTFITHMLYSFRWDNSNDGSTRMGVFFFDEYRKLARECRCAGIDVFCPVYMVYRRKLHDFCEFGPDAHGFYRLAKSRYMCMMHRIYPYVCRLRSVKLYIINKFDEFRKNVLRENRK